MSETRPLPQTVVEALRRTKEVLQQHGRTQRQNWAPDGKVCLWAAVILATGLYLEPSGEAYAGLQRAIAPDEVERRQQLTNRTLALLDSVVPPRHCGVIEFNDDPRTTDEDVTVLIDDAIASVLEVSTDQ
jgi:hypothetical protein